MDYIVSREGELEVDLESGGNTSEEDRTEDLVATDRPKGKTSERAWSADFGFAKSEKSVYDETIHSNPLRFWENVDPNVELSKCKNSDSEESMALVAKKHVKDKRKKINSRNPLKPPRPPKGPSLDAADRKLIREMAELAVRKRARVERMKTLKKVKASEASPTRSSLYGMVITLLFCLVLIYQGLSSRSSAGTSPAINEDLISVQFYNNVSAPRSTKPGSTSQNLVEDRRVSGSDLQGETVGNVI